MSKIYEFNPQIYPRRVWVTIAPDIKDIKERFGDEVEPLDECADADVQIVQQKDPELGGVLIRFVNRKAMTANVIAHECSHAAIAIFSYCECKISDDNQEPFAYLVGWLAGCCEKVKQGKAG